MTEGTDMNQIEKVARAMCRADPEIHMGDAEGVVQQLVETEWRNYISAAKAAATVSAEVMAAKDAEIARLGSDNEGLREMLRIVEDPDRQLCCSGYQCGCMGSTVGQYAAWAFRDTAAKDAELAELRAEIEALRGRVLRGFTG